jgi:hypothetical protein
MFHNFYFFVRKASLDREGFHRHYLEKHLRDRHRATRHGRL